MTTLHKLLMAFIIAIVMLFTSCSSDDDNNTASIDYTTAENLLTDINFQGYAIITKNGSDLVRQGFGLANENTALPQDYQLAYRIGSVSKTLTAASIIQLKRDGYITSFNQTLDEFDSEFPNGDQITIAHLLSHQSGIPDYQFVVEDAAAQGSFFDEEDIYEVIIELITENGLNFTPGAGKQYSNSNYLIAALLIQELTQMPYHDYIQQNIFNPLEMTNTYRGTDHINPNTHAEGYNNGSANSIYPMNLAFGAGDFSSTPKDMETWTNAVKTNWFSATEKKEDIFAQDVPSGYVDFGLGWFTTQEGNTTLYWHGGDIDGYWSMIGFVPEYNATIVLLSNQQDDSGEQRNTIIQQLLTNEFN
ncbi:CubicO group peptidase (beta-lactamase class C family) [Mesoflavibacter sabulilitoris]|uniref:Serine hydrolase n=1 Tax=Mesoflavibacter zeaxanthinifaciens subsp. sabulilitoris TaxID=1520893 RepID=A0A2T1NH61_9FLAO|nr:serine hydrolase domain-containing protein [Mesoflavibacter zeaxanthinifaciens]MBB3122744.1 CubicO group peptidase (beta-lactamase class C family) [Mesoflavibacter zeaxanthinifaciens subsp. sabulilitoris]PSG92170.1 serine hydrolase [Mesoflavibacter zeaxanthinifaciens subsp. sabulilitoris]